MKNRHWGITVLAILGYIGAALTLLMGLGMMLGAGTMTTFLATFVPGAAVLLAGGTALFVVLGIVFVALSVLNYFIARGLWNGQNWARIITIVFAALGIVSALMSFNIVSILIDGVILWYLAFYKPAVNYFK